MNLPTKESLIAFEARIAAAWDAGDLAGVTHLCGGNEDQLLEIFARIRPRDWVYSTHRAHYHALLKGVPEAHVEAQIRAARSMYLFSAEHRFLCTAILAGQCGICAGIAWDIKRRGDDEHVYCFLGDGAEEEGHFYEAALTVEAHDLPCTFIIEDNGWQMDTPKWERRGNSDTRLEKRKAFAPLDHFNCIQRYHYTRTYPHSGTGKPVQITPEAIARAETHK